MAVFQTKWKDEHGKERVSPFWSYEFVFAGQRVRATTKSTRKSVAREAETNRRLELERVAAGLPPKDLPVQARILRVADLIDAKAKEQAATRAENTAGIALDRGRHVKRILGKLLRADLNREKVVAYILQRKQEGASPRSVNMETQLLASAMGSTRLRLWGKGLTQIERTDIGRALSQAEVEALIAAARINRSHYVYPFVLVGARALMRSDEIKALHWRDIDFAGATVSLAKSKTEAGRRTIPLTADVVMALQEHMAWCARKLKRTIEPNFYVFPSADRGKPLDPARPIGSIKTAWRSVRDAAGLACRFHDLRHTGITTLLENNIPESTVKELVGHVAQRVILRYSHPRAEAKRAAVEVLVPKGTPPSRHKVGDGADSETAVTV